MSNMVPKVVVRLSVPQLMPLTLVVLKSALLILAYIYADNIYLFTRTTPPRIEHDLPVFANFRVEPRTSSKRFWLITTSLRL